MHENPSYLQINWHTMGNIKRLIRKNSTICMIVLIII